MSKKKSDSIGSLTEQLSSIYENDSTLSYLKKFEEDRQSLLGLATSSWQEPTIQEKIADMASVLGMSDIQDAFKTHEDYEHYANPILSSIQDSNYSLLQEELQKASEPWLSNDYLQTMKAADIFSDTVNNVADMGVLHNTKPYSEKLAETISLFNNHNSMLGASKNLVSLASVMENDAFKIKFESPLGDTAKKLSEAINGFGAARTFDNPILKVSESLKGFDKPIGSINPPDLSERILDFPRIKPPKIEDSPMYKQNEKLIDKSDKQVLLLEDMSKYMASQTEKLEFQNEITSQQIEANEGSAKIAFWTAISSILVAVIFSVAGIGLTYYIFQEEDKSENKNHAEMKALVEANNNNKILGELILQLKQQNKNSTITNTELIKQNQYFKKLLKAKK